MSLGGKTHGRRANGEGRRWGRGRRQRNRTWTVFASFAFARCAGAARVREGKSRRHRRGLRSASAYLARRGDLGELVAMSLRDAVEAAAALNDGQLRHAYREAVARGLRNTGCRSGQERAYGTLRLLTLATLRLPDLALYAHFAHEWDREARSDVAESMPADVLASRPTLTVASARRASGRSSPRSTRPRSSAPRSIVARYRLSQCSRAQEHQRTPSCPPVGASPRVLASPEIPCTGRKRLASAASTLRRRDSRRSQPFSGLVQAPRDRSDPGRSDPLAAPSGGAEHGARAS